MIKIKFSGKKNSSLQLEGNPSFISLIRENFSVPNPAYRGNSQFSQPRLYCITPSGKFEVGLLKEITNFISRKGIMVEIEDDIKSVYKPINLTEDIDIDQLSLKYRDYQEECIRNNIGHGRGITILPTAGGKTYVMAGLIFNIKKILKNDNLKSLILVPSIQLVEQTYKDFLDYGLTEITKWSGKNKPDFNNSKIIIAGTQILLSKSTDLSVLSEIDLFLCDECIRKNTLISTSKGDVKIQNIKIGDLVKSFNKDSNKIEYKPVLNIWKNLNKSNSCENFLEIELDNGNIVHLTPNHKIYTNKGYKRADELTENDDILCINSPKWVNLRCKYLYAKTNIETYLFNMWGRNKVRFTTFKKNTFINIFKRLLRQFLKKTIRRTL